MLIDSFFYEQITRWIAKIDRFHIGGDTSVMANYLPIMLTPTAMNWFTSLAPDSIRS